jgi:hypothetical protein
MTDDTANSDERRRSPREVERGAAGKVFGEQKEGVVAGAEKPWLALRGRGKLCGDPFAPVINQADVEALR